MKKIWVLFSVANEYYQPDNNLEAWWSMKPSIAQIAKVIGINVDLNKGNPMIGKIWRGEDVRGDGASFRLEEIEEGKHIESS